MRVLILGCNWESAAPRPGSVTWCHLPWAALWVTVIWMPVPSQTSVPRSQPPWGCLPTMVPYTLVILTFRKVPENICFQRSRSAQPRAGYQVRLPLYLTVKPRSTSVLCTSDPVISADVYNKSRVHRQLSFPLALSENTFSSLDLVTCPLTVTRCEDLGLPSPLLLVPRFFQCHPSCVSV